jgi:hypothetical protein
LNIGPLYLSNIQGTIVQLANYIAINKNCLK